MFEFPEWQRDKWMDLPQNPIIRYFDKEEKANAAIGDPQILVPGEADNEWHCFYHGFYDSDFLPYYHHLVSEDGIHWHMKKRW